MSEEVKIPEIGESITSGILTAWLKQEGEAVSEGEDLYELETDKATLAVPSPFSGVLRIQVESDAEVTVGQVVATLEVAATLDTKATPIATAAAPPDKTAAEATQEAEEPAGGIGNAAVNAADL